ncbi:Mediator of RNA polymerase II transcription subunit 32 [Vigna angularis]|uniref:Mediator of RNA polymerase II transcription subunit 32 n=5 Tax=Vigna TaxID=3913 RepID=A0A8T0JP38_PHAAN|nr:Mediator of RNA polymerase II transcription subunit 32 [Vigna angularis]
MDNPSIHINKIHPICQPIGPVRGVIASSPQLDRICSNKNLRIYLVNTSSPMDSVVDSLNNAYQDFVSAAANVLEAKENAGSVKTTATDTALENFKQKWELFRVACDQAEEFVESVKQRIGSECLVDEATRPVAGKPGQATMTGLPPISAVRLEQMSKAVRWLVIELQHGSGASSANSALSHPSAPFDARFSEDATQ